MRRVLKNENALVEKEMQFLQLFCDALAENHFDEGAGFFSIPSVIVQNNINHVFQTKDELATWLASFSKASSVDFEKGLSFKLAKSVNLSSNISFSQVNLHVQNIDGEKRDIPFSFTLGFEDNKYKILVVVVDDQ